MLVKYLGTTTYMGFDGDRFISIEPKQIIEVSDEKGRQLLRDFPKQFIKMEEIKLESPIRKEKEIRKEESKPRKKRGHPVRKSKR